MFAFHLDRDVEKTHGCRLSIGRNKGVSFSIQWRSWQPNYTPAAAARVAKNCYAEIHEDDVYDPWMLSFNVFVFGTFLGVRPFSDTYLGRRCASNGVNLFHWTAIKPKEN